MASITLNIGFEIRPNPLVPKWTPKYQLPATLDVPEDWRRDFDYWLRGTFGKVPPVYILDREALPVRTPGTARFVAMIHPDHFEEIRDARQDGET